MHVADIGVERERGRRRPRHEPHPHVERFGEVDVEIEQVLK